MKKNLAIVAVTSILFGGCASVPMESPEKSEQAKRFVSPSTGNAALYIYRSGSFGGALKKDVWVDGKCIGETAPNTFFREEVTGGSEHRVSTESEFSPNDLTINAEAGKTYFVQQYIKIGLVVGGANLRLVDEDKGKSEVMKLEMAVQGKCSK